jgi:hypothetical protein
MVIHKVFYGAVISMLLISVITACNRDFDTRLDTSVIPDTTIHQASSQNKVLYVVVDGGIGKVITEQSVRDNVYPNINALAQTAIFSGASLTDNSNVEATTYADMFTGVRKAKHGVIASSGTNNLNQYKPFVENLLAANANYTTSAFVQSEFIYNNLVKSAVSRQLLTSDQTVQAAAVANLTTTTSSVIVAQYTGLKRAGETDGYGPSSTGYLSALQAFDTFLGSLLKAIKSRSSAASENWVIIVASNKGGKYTLAENEDDGSDFSNTERNGFIIISNPNFNLDYFPVPDMREYSVNGTSPEELGPADRQGALDSASARIYNLGTSGNYTIQFKANISNRSTNATIPAILSKSSASSGANPTNGWSFLLHAGTNTNWSFRVDNNIANTGPSYELGVWNTFTAVIFDSAGKRYTRTYLNGVAGARTDISNRSLSTNSSLIIGGGPSYGANSFRGRIFDIRIYNTALPENHIRANYCRTFVNTGEPYAENLIGYWPGVGENSREASEKIFIDYSASRRDVKFGAAAVWGGLNVTGSANICPVYPDVELNKIPFSVDIPRFIYTWMGIFNVQSYQLDGKLITPTYRSTGSAN